MYFDLLIFIQKTCALNLFPKYFFINEILKLNLGQERYFNFVNFVI